MTHDVFCSLPFSSVSIDGPGRTRVCCNNIAHWNDTDAQRISQCKHPADALNTAIHKEIRRSISQGKRHESCTKCWDMEDGGARSFRQIWNDILDLHAPYVPLAADGSLPTPNIRYLDITLGNKCNLVCRMCNWANSHLWLVDDQRLGRYQDIDPSLIDQTWFEDSNNIDLLCDTLPHVVHMNFLGGEPLIVRSHLKLLNRAIDLGRAGEITLSYNTNLTHLDDEYIKAWLHFKHVRINASIEAVGDANDYIRQNSHWLRIQTNLDMLLAIGDPITLDIHSTFGVYNALLIPALMHWSYKRLGILPWLNVVTNPSEQDTRHLPDACKQQVSGDMLTALKELTAGQASDRTDIYHGAVTHMHKSRDNQRWLAFWDESHAIDHLKQRKMYDYIPALWEWHP